MSQRIAKKRRFAAIVLACGIISLTLAPTAANAGYEFIFRCQPIPGSTPGVTVLGQHVPAISNMTVCAAAGFEYYLYPPTVTTYDNCGTPCFAVKAYVLPAQAKFWGAAISFRWWEDGIEKFPGNPGANPISLPPAGPDPSAPQEICLLAVGSPTPPCTL